MLPVREILVFALVGVVGLPFPAGPKTASEFSGTLPPLSSSPKLPSQSPDESPLVVILRAIRATESGESAEMEAWQRVVGANASTPGPAETREERLALLGLAASAWARHQHQDVDRYLQEILREADQPTEVTPFAWVIQGESLAARARLRQADSVFSRAIRQAEELNAPQAKAWGLIRLANVRGRLTGNSGEAARLLVQAQHLLGPGDSFLMGQFHCIRGGNDPQGEWSPEEDARAGMAYARTAGVRRLHAACLHVLASDQIRRGLTTEALATFREEQAEQQAIGDRAGRAATLQWAGYVLFTLGDYATSRAYLLEAVSEGEASGNLSPVAWAYLSLSGIAQGLGDLPTARTDLDRAEELLTAQGDQWGLLTLKGRRGSVAFASGRYRESRQIFQEVLEQNILNRNPVGALSAMTSLLELALAQDDLEAADSLLAQARATASDAGMGAWIVSFYFHEAEIALGRGDPQGAREALERFLESGQFTVRTYRAQVRYAEALAMEGREAEAGAYLERALDALERWRSGLDPSGLQRYAFQIGEYLPDPDLGVATVVAALVRAGLVNRAFELAERQKARALYDRMVLAEIGRPRSVSEQDQQVPALPSPMPLTAEEVLSELQDPSLAVIEFFSGWGGEPTTAFVLSRDTIEGVTLPPVDDLQRDIVLLRSLVESGEDHEGVALRLGHSLLSPVLPRVPPGVSTLVLVPSGPLHQVPFDLVRSSGQKPLVADFALAFAPSASVLARLRRPGTPLPSSLLALANPTLPVASPVQRGQEDADGGEHGENGGPRGVQEWEPLPGAAREGRMVARFGNPSDLRRGGEASEAFLKSTDLSRYGVVHFATHAQVDPASSTGTYLVLAPGGGEDGLLYSGDVAGIRLGPSLVVLSSCRTASGTLIRGEGVQGLTTAFFRAGARTIVATGWPIEDRWAASLIRDFYQELSKGSSAGSALRRAKLNAMDRGEPARVWGAFNLVGDPALGVAGLRSGRPGPGFLLAWGLGFLIVFWGLVKLRQRTAARQQE